MSVIGACSCLLPPFSGPYKACYRDVRGVLVARALVTMRRDLGKGWRVLKKVYRIGGVRSVRTAVSLALLGVVLFAASPVSAEKIENPIAVFAALDKVTARISHLEVKLGETVRFGALKVTPRVCYSRHPTEPPLTSSFVEVEEIRLSGEPQRIFTGWMFAESPGLHAVEHAVFDVWLTSCKMEDPEALAGSPKKSARSVNAPSSNR